MSRGPIVFAGDLHHFPEPAAHPGRARFLALMEHLAATTPGELWLTGDLFDFWFEWGPAAPAGHEAVLCAIRRLSGLGWRVWFIPGNHDWWVGRRFESMTGAAVRRERAVEIDALGLRALAAHGDGLGSGDPGYRLLLRPLLRAGISRALFSMIHPVPACRLAAAASGTSRRILRRTLETLPGGLLEWVDGRAAEGYDLVVTGHAHVAADRTIGGTRHISVGDWLSAFTFAVVDGDGPRLVTQMEDGSWR